MRLHELPGISALFADLAEGVPAVRQFFPDEPNARRLRSRAAAAQARCLPRQELCDLLLRQAEWFSCSDRSIAAIEKLRSPKTAAIVASLRPNLFGGTLDGWFKLCTAARLAAWLEDQGVPAVPVCWIDSARSTELQSVRLLGTSGPCRYELDPDADGATESAGRVASLLDRVGGVSGPADPESDLRMLLTAAYRPDGGLLRGCGRTLARLLDEAGLVFVDPLQPGMENLAAVPEKHLCDGAFEEARARLGEQLRAAGYAPALMETDTVQEHKNRRNVTGTFPAEASFLAGLIMPVATVVADEIEIYDFAINQPVFAAISMDPPLVWPRVSGTIVDVRCRKLLARHELQLRDLFDGAGPVVDGIMRRRGAADAQSRLRSLRADLDRQLNEIAVPAAASGRLRTRIENSRRRMRYQIEKLESRFLAARESREVALRRQVSRLCDTLAPGGRLQEREYAGIQFVLRHSLRLPQILCERIDPWDFTHQLIAVD